MNPQELIDALQNFADGEEMYRRLSVAIPQLDAAGQDSLWAALKKTTDEVHRVDLRRGQMMADWMIELSSLTGNPLHRALGLLAKANVISIGLGEFHASLALYNEAAAVYAAHNRPVEEAQSQIGKLYVLANLGRYAEALADGERAAGGLSAYGEMLLL